jgi:hypothetical protein
MRGIARTAVVAGTATAVSGRVSRRQQGRWAAKDQQQAQAEAPPPEEQQVYAPQAEAEPSPGDDMDDKLAQLKSLGELKQAGVLTDAEFEVQKDKILHP